MAIHGIFVFGFLIINFILFASTLSTWVSTNNKIHWSLPTFFTVTLIALLGWLAAVAMQPIQYKNIVEVSIKSNEDMDYIIDPKTGLIVNINSKFGKRFKENDKVFYVEVEDVYLGLNTECQDYFSLVNPEKK